MFQRLICALPANKQMRITLACVLTFTVVCFAVQAKALDASEYEEIEWTELMPNDDLEALLNPPSYLDDIEEGSRIDSLDTLLLGDPNDPRTARYNEALGSMRVVEAFDKRRIKIPGFIVPLSSDEDQNITEFFIVPYFGACLHLPPPPPNQILHVTTDLEVRLENLDDAFWFEGQVNIESTDKLLGKSAYTLRLDKVYEYD